MADNTVIKFKRSKVEGKINNARGYLTPGEPLVDLANKYLYIGNPVSDGSTTDDPGYFMLGDHNLSAANNVMSLTRPDGSTADVKFISDNGIDISTLASDSANPNRIKICNKSDADVEFANLTLNGGSEAEGGQITLLHGDGETDTTDIVIDNASDTFRIFGIAKDTKTQVGSMLILDPNNATLSTPEDQDKYNFDGNSATATKFDSARKIKLTGNVTGEIESDGASGWSIATEVSLEGYSKGSSDAISPDDTLNAALGKLEYKADNHKHSTSYTPEGTVSATFTGTSNQTTEAAGSATVGSSGKTMASTTGSSTVDFSTSTTYTPAGSINADANITGSATASTSKITGCLVTNAGTPASCTLPTLSGTAPSISANISGRKMTISIINGSYSLSGGNFTANTLPTLTNSVDVSTADHTHAVTVTHGTHTFAGEQATITSTATGTTHSHDIPQLDVSVSGTIGNHTHTYTAAGTVSATFSGTSTTLNSETASY